MSTSETVCPQLLQQLGVDATIKVWMHRKNNKENLCFEIPPTKLLEADTFKYPHPRRATFFTAHWISQLREITAWCPQYSPYNWGVASLAVVLPIPVPWAHALYMFGKCSCSIIIIIFLPYMARLCLSLLPLLKMNWKRALLPLVKPFWSMGSTE